MIIATAGVFGCGGSDPTAPPLPGIEWVSVSFGAGDIVSVAVLLPDDEPKGVIIALPGGSGRSELVVALLDEYWDDAARDAGYVIAGVEANGPALESLGRPVMAAILSWIDIRFPTAADEVVLTGVDNGGIGAFHAALAVPARVGGIIAMPGYYPGDPAALAALADVPVWLMAGENDAEWLTSAQTTLMALSAAGVSATLDILAGQDHVLSVSQRALVDWITSR